MIAFFDLRRIEIHSHFACVNFMDNNVDSFQGGRLNILSLEFLWEENSVWWINISISLEYFSSVLKFYYNQLQFFWIYYTISPFLNKNFISYCCISFLLLQISFPVKHNQSQSKTDFDLIGVKGNLDKTMVEGRIYTYPSIYNICNILLKFNLFHYRKCSISCSKLVIL